MTECEISCSVNTVRMDVQRQVIFSNVDDDRLSARWRCKDRNEIVNKGKLMLCLKETVCWRENQSPMSASMPPQCEFGRGSLLRDVKTAHKDGTTMR